MLPTHSPLILNFKNLYNSPYLSSTYLLSPSSPMLYLFARGRPAFPMPSGALLTLFFSFGSSFSSMCIMRALLGAIPSTQPWAQTPGSCCAERQAMLWQLPSASIYIPGEPGQIRECRDRRCFPQPRSQSSPAAGQ